MLCCGHPKSAVRLKRLMMFFFFSLLESGIEICFSGLTYVTSFAVCPTHPHY